jgi:hypothetical protein
MFEENMKMIITNIMEAKSGRMETFARCVGKELKKGNFGTRGISS